MLRVKIHWYYDYDQENVEYWTIKDYIRYFDEELEARQNMWGAGAHITIVEMHYHKHCRLPYYEVEILPKEIRR